ncbi:alpha/beta hydrolase [Sporosarcina sp. Te-1]|uniref:alpha/beta hydrolase n=1 Tax=Sporosarcina sp. Te-1 TaxID=2818390 RepID=UPI001A9E70A3|nr:alpha/beta hydrolase [Sporosarcina sp. Te-1]QTD42520.1 alpha/beta hydrolase [Sporosarcina sp. Te-1]
MKAQLSKYIKIGSSKQFISIIGEDNSLPLLVYLHGGPGDAALPLVYKYNSELGKTFNLVVWEQRGAGKSYYTFSEEEQISIETYIEDLYSLIQYLLETYKQKKVYLVAHSWGSVLGLLFIKKYPHLVHSYVGCGQVVNMKKGLKCQYDFVLKESQEQNKKKLIQRLEYIDLSLTQKDWLNDLLFVTKLVVRYKHSLYGKSNYNQLVRDFIFSPKYTIKDLIKREKGSLQSIQYLWQELMEIDFSEFKSFDVPITFFEGRHDRHASSFLVEDYYHTIKTEKNLIWFENSSHFPQWEESVKFNQSMISIIKQK